MAKPACIVKVVSDDVPISMPEEATINDRIASLYNQYDSMMRNYMFSDADRELFYSVKKDMDEPAAA